jgi:hypothetical protein
MCISELCLGICVAFQARSVANDWPNLPHAAVEIRQAR